MRFTYITWQRHMLHSTSCQPDNMQGAAWQRGVGTRAQARTAAQAGSQTGSLSSKRFCAHPSNPRIMQPILSGLMW